MRNSADYAERLLKLCRKLRRAKGATKETGPSDPIEEIILGFLTEQCTESKAVTLLHKMQKYLVDYNELRVCRDIEISKLWGSSVSNGREAARKIINALQEIYDLNDSIELEFLQEGGKREARTYLDNLKNINAYVAARVMLLSLEAHAFPVHEAMLTMLRGEDLVDAKADLADVQGFLERQIPAKDLNKYYPLLRDYADRYKVPSARKKATAAKRKAAAKKTATGTKAATKKKAARKKTS